MTRPDLVLRAMVLFTLPIAWVLLMLLFREPEAQPIPVAASSSFCPPGWEPRVILGTTETVWRRLVDATGQVMVEFVVPGNGGIRLCADPSWAVAP